MIKREQEPIQPLPHGSQVTEMTTRLVLWRERRNYQRVKKGRQGRILSPKVHPGTGEPEGLLDRVISHRLLAELPPGNDVLQLLRHVEEAYVYRREGRSNRGQLVHSSFGSSLHREGVPAYGLPTREAIRHPLRTLRDVVGSPKRRRGRYTLVDFGQTVTDPPKRVQLPPIGRSKRSI